MYRIALVFGIAASAVFILTEAEETTTAPSTTTPPGCPAFFEHEHREDPDLLPRLKAALSKAGASVKAAKINKTSVQVADGLKYIVDFVTEDNKTCHCTWMDQPWVTKDPVNPTYKCD